MFLVFQHEAEADLRSSPDPDTIIWRPTLESHRAFDWEGRGRLDCAFKGAEFHRHHIATSSLQFREVSQGTRPVPGLVRIVLVLTRTSRGGLGAPHTRAVLLQFSPQTKAIQPPAVNAEDNRRDRAWKLDMGMLAPAQ